MFTKVLGFVVTCLVSTVVLATPQIETWTTDNQTRVLYVHAPELPMVDVSVVFNAGAARDGDKLGLARMTIAMLNEGAGDMNADAIAASFEDVGARFGVSAERDMAVVSLRTITEEKALAQALKTFNTVLTQPTFPQQAFDRIQRNVLTGLQAENQSPRAIAARSFYTELFKNHPYGVMPQGTVESVSVLKVEDLKAFYSEHFVSANAVMAIVGDVDRQQAEKMAQSIMAGLPQGKAAPAIPAVPELASAKVIKHDFPSSQTTIFMGQVGMARHDDDYFALYVGNHI
jgi:zinc protease